MKIYLDIDEVVGDFLSGLETLYPEYKKCDQKIYDLPEYVCMDDVCANEKFWIDLAVNDRPDFTISGYVSHRPFSTEITRRWLQRNKLPLATIYHVSDSYEKVGLLKALKADVYVDDKPSTFKECIKAGINVYLYDQPWNRKIETDKRIKNLKELKEKLNL